MRNEDYKDRGLIYFTDSMDSERATAFANTYVLSVNGREYVIDASCGRKRYRDIKAYLRGRGRYSILCTHYHNDHIANNGRLARRGSPIIYHRNAASKVAYLRTNATGQILKMYRDMGRKGFLGRLGIFNDTQVRLLLKRKVYARYVAEPLLFAASGLVSLRSIGRIYTGRRYIRYLKNGARTCIELNGMKAEGWRIDESLFAFLAPGHSDCHAVFYLRSAGVLVAGDALNFLTPNDIQYGTVMETIEAQKFLLQLVKNEKVEILCQGHYPPVTGNENIISYISGIIEKHEYMYDLTRDFLAGISGSLTFDELYDMFCSIDDPAITRLKKITFPRSTLVFLDVYLLKMIEETGINPMDTGKR